MNRYTKPLVQTLLVVLVSIAAVSLRASAQFTTLANSTAFDSPYGIAVDASGNVYVADTFNNRVQKITSGGIASVLAGSASGDVDANGTNALFSAPRGVAVDSSGNVYVADAGNNSIRKITPAGDVTTLASGLSGPWGVAMDLNGNILVANTFGHTILKITPAGAVSSVAGSVGVSGQQDGVGAAARFNVPTGLAVDSAGNIYVADSANHAIRKIDSNAKVTTFAGGGTGGLFGFTNATGVNARFSFPHGVAIDDNDNVYVADASNNAIRKITPAGVVTTFAGAATAGYVDGSDANVRFNSPNGVATDGAGKFYIADTLNNKIRQGVQDPAIPVITTQPVSQTFAVGYSVTFKGGADGYPAPSYKWQKNGVDIVGANGTSVTISNISSADAGSYALVAFNSAGSATSSAAVLTVVAAKPAASASTSDFDGDGQSDLIWQNTVTGERSFWLMNGTVFKVGSSMGTFAPDWTIVGSGDFNHDGQADLLWQNMITGERTIWLMNRTSLSLGVNIGTYSTDWMIAGSGDFNGDGETDIVVQNTITGERVIWLMNGTTKVSEASLGFVATNWSIGGTGDFNGDGKMDLVWQNAATGERSIWLMNGTTVSSVVALEQVAKGLQIVGTGDYNHDGKTDLVWTNTETGERVIWLMNGVTPASKVTFTLLSVEWSLGRPIFLTAQAAHADFDADGNTDLVWQNSATGERTITLMSGSSISSTVSLGTTSSDWVISGTGDFNHDDKPDLVWSNTTTGERKIWLMDGTTMISSVTFTTISPIWSISAIADFNYDGKPDIVWTNTTTGERAIWLMNGTVFGSGVSLGTVSTAWKIATAADLNGDGKADLIWQNTSTGESSVWLMNGGALTLGVVLDTLPVQWAIVGSGDFNADGKTDLVLQNTSNGQRAIRLMDRTTFVSNVSLGTFDTHWSILN